MAAPRTGTDVATSEYPIPMYQPSTAHAALGLAFYDQVEPARFPKLTLRHRDQRAAARVGLDRLDDAAWARYFGRFEALPGSLPERLALRYHGHQLGH